VRNSLGEGFRLDQFSLPRQATDELLSSPPIATCGWLSPASAGRGGRGRVARDRKPRVEER